MFKDSATLFIFFSFLFIFNIDYIHEYEIFLDMKFDIILGNPPYNTKGRIKVPTKSPYCCERLVSWTWYRSTKKKVSSFMLDFELAMIKAVKSVFKRTTTRCCKFRLGQNWWRKIKEVSLSVTYKNRKSALSKWLRRIFGLICFRLRRFTACSSCISAQSSSKTEHPQWKNFAATWCKIRFLYTPHSNRQHGPV